MSAAAALLLVALLAACGGNGGGGGSNPPPPTVTVVVSPATVAALLLGGTQQFSATVTGSTNTAVTWTVSGTGCAGTACGTIDAAGLYTAPINLPNPASVTIRATSAANPANSGTAALTITSDVAVAVAPGTPSLNPGAQQQFTATVTSTGNRANTAVTWAISGAGCAGGGNPCGTISAAGLYTAPSIKPNPATVTITATSVADPSKNSGTNATIAGTFTVNVTGPASVNNGATGTFTANLVGAPAAAAQTFTWSVGPVPGTGTCTGPGTGQGQCGTIVGGLYTAPNIAPSAPGNVVRVTATSDADNAISGNAPNTTINILIIVTVAPTPATNVELESQRQFTATVSGTVNTGVTWSVSGTNCGASLIGGVSANGLYTAPASMPLQPNCVVTVTATSVDPGATPPNNAASTTVTLFSTITVAVAFTNAGGTQVIGSGVTRSLNRRVRLTATLAKASGGAPLNTAVEYRVNNVPGGSLTDGQICLDNVDFTPCTATGVASADGNGGPPVDYLAPAGGVPANPVVTITVVSQADPSKSGSVQVTVTPNVSVQISPTTSSLPTNNTQVLNAGVIGTYNQNIRRWLVNGIVDGNNTVGQMCTVGSNPCNPPSATTPAPPAPPTVEYRSPAVAPNPANVTVTAESDDDPTRTATSSVTIQTGAFISTMLPASITAGPANAFLLRVRGTNFVSSTPGPGSTIQFNGTNLTTSCLNTGGVNFDCTATINPAAAPGNAVAAPGNYTVQISNPAGAPFPGLSNSVNLVVLPDAATEAVINLTPGAPNVANQDITVVEPTTAGSALNAQITIDTIGLVTAGACSASGTSLVIQRPAAGTQSFDVCVHIANGDLTVAGHTYSISGPAVPDITITSAGSLGGNSVFFAQITISVPSTAQPGPRSVFIKTPNKEKTAITGGLVIK